MKNLIRLDKPRAVRSAWAVSTAVAVAAAIAGGAASQPKNGHSTVAGLVNGVLKVEGTNASDRIAVGLQAGQLGVIQVDVGDDGSADFSFERRAIATIVVDAGNGDDSVRIDESNGDFSDTIPTTIEGGNGTDRLLGGHGDYTLFGGSGA